MWRTSSLIPIKKAAVILVLVGVLASGLAACGNNAPADTGTSPAPGAEQGINVANFAPGDAGAAINGGSVPAQVSTALPETDSQPITAAPNGEISADEILAAFEEALSGVYEDVVPSVVYIRARYRNVPDNLPPVIQESLPEELEEYIWSQGSGFVWDGEGHIVTNYHVIENAEELVVYFSDSTQAKATVVGSDPHSDLAVIKLEEGDWTAHSVDLGDSSEVRPGQLALAIGAPFGQEFTMTSGIISAVGRLITTRSQFSIPEVIQTDAAINPGNSGGPLLDRQGRVIGINTHIISNTGNYSGVGMAVPINIASRVVPSLIADGEFNYSWLGVRISTVDSVYAEISGLPADTRGALIVAVVEDGPADKAGLRGSNSSRTVDGRDYALGGDIVIAAGETQITKTKDLIAYLTYYSSPGDAVTFTVLRDGQQETIEVTLGERPKPESE